MDCVLWTDRSKKITFNISSSLLTTVWIWKNNNLYKKDMQKKKMLFKKFSDPIMFKIGLLCTIYAQICLIYHKRNCFWRTRACCANWINFTYFYDKWVNFYHKINTLKPNFSWQVTLFDLLNAFLTEQLLSISSSTAKSSLTLGSL